MGNFTGRYLVLHITIALLGAMLLPTDGDNITWLEPPPSETVTDASSITRTDKVMSQGSLNEELNCNFSLTPDLNITTVSMKFRGRPAVTFVPNVLPHVELAFAQRFNAVWVPNKLTLILFNVTPAEAGEYCCEVVTIGMSARSWIRKIQLLVIGQRQTTVSTFTASEGQRQTTLSTFTASEGQRQTTVSNFTASEDSTGYSITASEGNVPWGIIGAVVGVAIAIAIAIAIAMVWFLKRRKRSQQEVHLEDRGRNDSGGTDSVQMVEIQNARN